MILQLLDVLIGLTLIYLILSTAASAAVDLIEVQLRLRGRMLERGIAELLTRSVVAAGEVDELVEKLYTSPFFYSLYEGPYEKGGNKLPSEIPSERFAAALIAMAKEDPRFLAIADTMLKVSGMKFDDITADAEGFAKVRAALAAYYDESMARVTGWYRRHVRKVLLGVGLSLALVFNVDTVNILLTLSLDTELREKIVASAIDMRGEELPAAPVCGDDLAECDRLLRSRIDHQFALVGTLGLPLGWKRVQLPECVPPPSQTQCGPVRTFAAAALVIIAKLFGLLLTALAVTMGAPFWFDLLNKLLNLRDVLKRKAKPEPEPSLPTQARAADAQNGDGAVG